MQRSQSDSAAHKKEGTFLKSLILSLDSAECGPLCDSLERARREEKCIRHALFIMLMLSMLVAGGVGYCALLLPDVFRDLDHLLMRGLLALGLASLISQLVFFGYMLWHRSLVSRLHEECRLLVLATVCTQVQGFSAANPNDSVAAQSQRFAEIVHSTNSNETSSTN